MTQAAHPRGPHEPADQKVAFIHGRPWPHGFHVVLARSVGADFIPVDFRLPYHDRGASRIRRYLSWLVCAATFPQRARYDVFLTEGPQVPPVLMRWLGRTRPRQRVVALMDNETLYFLKSRRYSRTTTRGLLGVLRGYHALICIGQMQTELARELLGEEGAGPVILSSPSALSAQRAKELGRLTPDLSGRRIVLIANGPSGWRGWVKGFDLALAAVSEASRMVDALELKVVGEWDPAYVASVARTVGAETCDVTLLGKVSDLSLPLGTADLCIQLSRGEAFGISVLEALCAGVPTIVSDLTGAKEAVAKVDPRLVVAPDPAAAAGCIAWYFSLGRAEKLGLSRQARAIASEYNEGRAVDRFRDALTGVCSPEG